MGYKAKTEEISGFHNPTYSNAFEVIITHYESRILRFIKRMVKDPEASADILQDTFIATYYSLISRGSLEDYANSSELLDSLQPLLFTIARNKAISELRRRKYIQFVPFTYSSQSLMDSREALDQSIEYLIATRSGNSLENQVVDNDELKRAFEKVGREKLTPLLMYFDGFSYREIEKITGENMPCIKSKIFRSKQSLRQAIYNLRNEEKL
jgi:RNA polymerase sigma-70 factor (ECF subfamily)